MRKKYRGFQVDLRSDHVLGEYYFARRGDIIYESNHVLFPDEASLKQAEKHIKRRIDEYWQSCRTFHDYKAYLPIHKVRIKWPKEKNKNLDRDVQNIAKKISSP